jgi:hypothetical protein
MKFWVGGAPLGTAVQMVQSAQLYRLYHCTKGVASVEMLPNPAPRPLASRHLSLTKISPFPILTTRQA